MTGAETFYSDVKEVKNPSLENYKNIKPENKQTTQEVNDFWKGEFQKESEAAKSESNAKEYRDDNGVKYREDDNLIPNNEYEVRGYQYKTDGEGRIVEASGKLKILIMSVIWKVCAIKKDRNIGTRMIEDIL